MVSITNPKSWVKYNPKNCMNCMSGCCTLPVKVNAEDLYQMGLIEAYQVNGPLKRIANRLIKQGVLRSFSQKSQLGTLERRKNNDCVFLNKDRKCIIYERRPFICRSFPKFSANPGNCPRQKKSKQALKDYYALARSIDGRAVET
jgi:Fe-S-cluster containining protein